MKSAIEFHDSTVGAVQRADASTVITFQPAYVHRWEYRGERWFGSGWAQPATITVVGADPRESIVGLLPATLSGGFLRTASVTYDNLVPAPLDLQGDVLLRLELAGGRALKLSGNGVAIALFGQPTFVEELPLELFRDMPLMPGS